MRGMELVLYSGVDEVEVGVGGGVFEEDLFKHLGWVQELVDDRLALSTVVLNPLVIREPVEPWIDSEVLTAGMLQEEVSNWVMKRINGFSKFLGVSYDGFEDRTMQLFKDIEDRGRKDSVTEAKKGGSKAKKGARELKEITVLG